MTNLVTRYSRTITHITLQRSASHLTGMLTRADGAPVAAARIAVSSAGNPLRTVSTDALGQLDMPLPETLAAGSAVVAEFAGTDQLRGSRCKSLWSGR
jgi:hypothetical protein